MKIERSIFSWYASELFDPDRVFTFMNKYGLDAIYQHLTLDEPQEVVECFLLGAAANKKKVYLLAGEPEWALDVKKLVTLIGQAQPFDGIVVDVEPYLLQDFQHQPHIIMSSYVAAMRIAYRAAIKNNLKFILCMPYFYDDIGFQKKLEILIRDCCDGITVMNYYRGKEIVHLKNEARLCEQFKKTLETIYELQPPGKHDLKDENTYYHYGINKVYENYDQLAAHFKNQCVQLSFHEFKSFEKLTSRG